MRSLHERVIVLNRHGYWDCIGKIVGRSFAREPLYDVLSDDGMRLPNIPEAWLRTPCSDHYDRKTFLWPTLVKI